MLIFILFILFIIIYIIATVALFVLFCLFYNEIIVGESGIKKIITIGDLLDNSKDINIMFFIPIVNVVLLVLLMILICIYYIYTFLNQMINKYFYNLKTRIRNIKILKDKHGT